MSTTNGPLIRPIGIHHVRLTVTDIGRSREFYQGLLGVDPAADFSSETDAGVHEDPARLYGGCVFQVGDQILGLRPVADPGDSFHSTRVGLDHVSLQLGSIDELRGVSQRLDDAGIEHGDLIELSDFGIAIVSVQDPDDINLELTAAL